jgi:hypothetical protein
MAQPWGPAEQADVLAGADEAVWELWLLLSLPENERLGKLLYNLGGLSRGRREGR